MKKKDYLVASAKTKSLELKKWIVSAFSMVSEGPEDYKFDLYPYRLVRLPHGVYCIPNIETPEVLEKIEDASVTEPLFAFLEPMTFVANDSVNIKETVSTCVGNYLYNELCITPAFKHKLAFQLGKIDGGKLEDLIASKLQDSPDNETDKTDEYFYADELIIFRDRHLYLREIASLCVWSATEKVLTPAPGIREFKANLYKEYEGRLHDPVVLTEFEGKLKAFDAEYTKGDKAERGFLSGKVKDNARRKLFLCMGAEQTFSNSMHVTPVINSLDEGIPTDPKQFVAVWNGSRFGSFSRGSETVKGGVSAKILLRALNNFKIVKGDCGSKRYLETTFDKSDVQQLVGRTIIRDGKLTQVKKSDLPELIGESIKLRSPARCTMDGDQICSVCAGERLSYNPEGIPAAVTEISSIILTTSLKAMHSQVLSTGKYELSSVLS